MTWRCASRVSPASARSSNRSIPPSTTGTNPATNRADGNTSSRIARNASSSGRPVGVTIVNAPPAAIHRRNVVSTGRNIANRSYNGSPPSNRHPRHSADSTRCGGGYPDSRYGFNARTTARGARTVGFNSNTSDMAKTPSG